MDIRGVFVGFLFGYFTSLSLNTKIDRLHGRCSKIIYNCKQSNFEELQRKNNSVDARNIQTFATKMHKVANGISPDIMSEGFSSSKSDQLFVYPIHCLYSGTHAQNTVISPNFLVWKLNFVERHSFCDSPETMRKLCLSTKFPYQGIR